MFEIALNHVFVRVLWLKQPVRLLDCNWVHVSGSFLFEIARIVLGCCRFLICCTCVVIPVHWLVLSICWDVDFDRMLHVCSFSRFVVGSGMKVWIDWGMRMLVLVLALLVVVWCIFSLVVWLVGRQSCSVGWLFVVADYWVPEKVGWLFIVADYWVPCFSGCSLLVVDSVVDKVDWLVDWSISGLLVSCSWLVIEMASDPASVVSSGFSSSSSRGGDRMSGGGSGHDRGRGSQCSK